MCKQNLCTTLVSSGTHSGAYSTFWNLRASRPLQLPPPDFGPLLNFIGLELPETTMQDSATMKDPASPYEWLIERLLPGSVCPVELQQAMRARRLSWQAAEKGMPI